MEEITDYDEYFKNKLLGNIYACQYTWKLPGVVQVVGWTKNSIKPATKIRYAYLIFVELNNINHPYDNRGFGGGGESMIQIDKIKKIESPTYKAILDSIKLKININNDGVIFLSRGNPSSSIYESFHKVDDLEVFKWERHD